jgi:hypothetical protein
VLSIPRVSGALYDSSRGCEHPPHDQAGPLLWQSRCSSDDASRGRDPPDASRPSARHQPKQTTLFSEASATAVSYVASTP